MRIAQVAPIIESVPPKLYGGTERIVSYLAEELVRCGHDVTVFASGDSRTAAKLVAHCPEALRLANGADPLPFYLVTLDAIARCPVPFDVIHCHVDYLQCLLPRHIRARTLTTLHGRLDLPGQHQFYRRFSDLCLVSISDNQRLPMPPFNWGATVYHGLPKDLLSFNPRPEGDYLAFLGRISPEKRPDRAIQIAIRSGRRLKIAAKVDRADTAYFESKIVPLLDHPLIEFIGEVDEAAKHTLLSNAVALLFPIDWPEPFGLVMIEAMACGTPVIAFRAGSVPEIVDEGISGFIVDDVDAAIQAVGSAAQLDRAVVRRQFERRFTAERMASDYIAVYKRLQAQASEGLARDEAAFPKSRLAEEIG